MNEVATATSRVEAVAPITVDDLRRKAVRIKDMAEAESRLILDDQRTRVIVIGVVAVVAAVSVAYYLGTRRR